MPEPGHMYLPTCIRRCPECRDSAETQYIVKGLPGAAPHPDEEDRLLFAGCMADLWAGRNVVPPDV